LKICLVSSTGGHLSELKKIVPAIKDYEFFYATEYSEIRKDLSLEKKTYFLKQQDRKNFFLVFYLIKNLAKSLFIILKERPKIIISTGAGVILPICIIGKIFGAKIVYIESFAKINMPSITGKIIYQLADVFYVQWETMLDCYPKAKYRGALF